MRSVAGLADSLGVMVRRLAQDVQSSPFSSPAAGQQSQPMADAGFAALSSYLSIGANALGRIVEGRIVDTCAMAHTYKVFLDNGHAPMLGVAALDGPSGAFGPRTLSTLTPGSRVLCMVLPSAKNCWILHVLPPPDLTIRGMAHQVLFGATRNRVDEAHRLPLRLAGGRGSPCYIAGRPLDSLTGGERGWITPLGLRIFLDDFLATLGVDESCGVTAFYHDRLLRLAGRGLQLWTAASSREARLDEAEYFDIEGWSPYEWEHLGLFAPGAPFRELSAERWQMAEQEPHYSRVEPTDDYQTPWHRTRVIRGYLGHATRTIVQVPPTAIQRPHAALEGSQTGEVGAKHPKVSDDATLLDGRRIMQSAAGFAMIKRLGGTNPVQLRMPEDPDGDTSAQHKFAGRSGTGDALPITSAPAPTDEDYPHLQAAAAAGDLLGYTVNYAVAQPFIEHTGDWAVPEERDIPALAPGAVQYAGMQFSVLADEPCLPRPEPIEIPVDHRYGSTKYYPTEAGFVQLDDGGALWYDGYGSQILMTGGSIYLSCPGDIHLMPGRDLLLWAGRHLGVRAKQSAELAVTDGSVRIKAETHTQILAGNGGTGALLLESRASAASHAYGPGDEATAGGVHIKAADSSATILAGDVYVRTGGENLGGGNITLDAGKGDGRLIFSGDVADFYLKTAARQLFGNQGEITRVNQFSASGNVLGATTTVNGPLFANGAALFNGSIAVVGGHIATEQAKSASNFVGSLEGQSLRQARVAISTIQTSATSTLPLSGRGDYRSLFATGYYAAGNAGDDATIADIGFSWRSSEETGTAKFVLYESRWQQIARQTSQTLGVWAETPVRYRQTETYPLPGREAFAGTVFRKQDLRLVDFVSGHYVARGEELSDSYRTPQYAASVPAKLESAYTVIG